MRVGIDIRQSGGNVIVVFITHVVPIISHFETEDVGIFCLKISVNKIIAEIR